jgi:hypothetical protein
MSGPQLVMWYERAAAEKGYEKMLDLEILLVPHTERPNDSLRDLQKTLIEMTDPKN